MLPFWNIKAYMTWKGRYQVFALGTCTGTRYLISWSSKGMDFVTFSSMRSGSPGTHPARTRMTRHFRFGCPYLGKHPVPVFPHLRTSGVLFTTLTSISILIWAPCFLPFLSFVMLERSIILFFRQNLCKCVRIRNLVSKWRVEGRFFGRFFVPNDQKLS